MGSSPSSSKTTESRTSGSTTNRPSTQGTATRSESRLGSASPFDWLTLCDPVGTFLDRRDLTSRFSAGFPHVSTERRHALADIAGDETLGARDRALRILADWFGYRSDGVDLLCEDHAALVSTENSVFVHIANETIAANIAIVEPDGKPHAGKIRVPVFVTDSPRGDTRPTTSTWSATWSERAAILLKHLHQVNPACSVAVITDGVVWTLVHREESGAVTYGHFDSEIAADPVESAYRAAFAKLLDPRSLFGESAGNTLEDLFAASAKSQIEVSNSLGGQVRQACEQLVAALNRAQHEGLAPGLQEVPDREVYQAVVTVFMRVVFTAFAEERRLLPIDDYPLYEQQYSLGALLRDLDGVALRFGDDALAQRATAWPRLLALFRLIYGGTSHPDLRLCGYGGDLFDPDRFPFLEGRTGEHSWREELAAPPRMDDRVTRSLLRSLLFLGSSRVHFRSLEIEQIGHVYERLLDHGVETATEVMVGLVGRTGDEEEIALSELEALLKEPAAEQIAKLKELTGKTTDAALEKMRSVEHATERLHQLRRAARGDDVLFDRLSKVLWLIRDEYSGPVVLHPGERFLTRTSLRRETGTEYTPPALADEIAEWGLEPLVYDGPADGKPEDQWRIRTPKEILALRVCDPAVGSGAIIAAACRYLAGKLVDSWEHYGYPEARDVHALLRAKRLVAGACCYGVDMDPMALEMAKLSMWLLTAERDVPFTFLDHHFAAGNSLIGVHDLDQLFHAHINGAAGVATKSGQQSFNNLWLATAQQKVQDAAEWFAMIADIKPLDVTDVEQQAQLYREAREEVRPLVHLADAVIGVAFDAGDKKTKLQAGYQQLVTEVSVNWQHNVTDTPFTAGQTLRQTHQVSPLHWALVFPDIFVDGGKFDVLVGNPPFVGGKKLRSSVGDAGRAYLVNVIASGQRGSADLVAYFLLRAATVAEGFSLITTNTVSQGDTREVGLDQLAEAGWVIQRAVRSTPWPGVAAVSIAKIAARQTWAGKTILDGRPAAISTMLERKRAVTTPTRLSENAGKAFVGSFVLGMGFTLDPSSPRDAAVAASEQGKIPAVIFPYLNGDDLNSHPEQAASRLIINFRDWDEQHCKARYPEAYDKILRDVKPKRAEKDASRFPDMVNKWWMYWSRRPGLEAALADKSRTLAITIVSKLLLPAFVPADQVFAHALIVFAYDDDFHLGVLSSAFHQMWAVRYSSTMGDSPRYAPSDCFLTFPQPGTSDDVTTAAKRLDDHRSALLKSRRLTAGKKKEPIGLTGLYTLVHDPSCTDSDVVKLRDLHRELDEAVAKAYGWDLDLRYGHHETDRLGMRWTIHPDTWDTALDLLLELNQQRAAAQDAPPPDDETDMDEDAE